MEMSHRIRFWYQIFTKIADFLKKMAKYNFFGKKILWQAKKKTIVSWKCWNCLKIMLRHFLICKFGNLGNIFENHDQKMP